jgi:hypothetical protein
VDNFVQCQGHNPILHYANSLTLPNANLQQHQQSTASTTTANNHFAPYATSGSLTSTPITGSNPATVNQQQPPQPSKPFVHPGFNDVATPQQQAAGLPVPQLLMSMITPVHNQIESTIDSCFAW